MQLEVLSLHSSLRAVRLDHLSPKVATLLLFALPFLSHTLTTGPQRITDDVSEVDSSFQASPGPSSVGQRMNDLFFFFAPFFYVSPKTRLVPKDDPDGLQITVRHSLDARFIRSGGQTQKTRIYATKVAFVIYGIKI